MTERENVQHNIALGILISNKGAGSNLQALIDAIEQKTLLGTRIQVVISDREGAQGLKRASKHHINSVIFSFQKPKSGDRDEMDIARDLYSYELAKRLKDEGVPIVVMAGFSTILTRPYFDTFRGITINLHPGYIPDKKNEPGRYDDGREIPWNRGMQTEKAAANFLGLPFAYSTIHVATPEADFGPVLRRVKAPVLKDDTVDSLYERLKIKEHEGLIKVLNRP